jgi:hypothetical protein
MSKDKFYSDLAEKEYPAGIEIDGVSFDDNHHRLKARHFERGLEKGEELAKEFAEYAMQQGFVYVKSEYRNFQQLSDRSKDHVKTYDELFLDFINYKLKEQ